MTELGKIPPQAIDLEEIILGSILLEKRGAYLGMKLMSREHFYKSKHQIIFTACEAIQKASQPIDMLTVVEQLRKVKRLEEVGGALFISGLTDRVASTSNLEAHCRIVIQKHGCNR